MALNDSKYSCPQLAPLPHNIEAFDYYSDSRGSIRDPARYDAYEAAVRPLLVTEDATEAAADEFQCSGSGQAAACAAQILVQEAQPDAMTGSCWPSQ